jgi:hypothetical protein
MAYPPITTLPTPPSRQDPANFATEADAFLGALPTFQSETNSAGVYFDASISSAEVAAAEAVAAAATIAAETAASAASALAAATSETNAASSETNAAASAVDAANSAATAANAPIIYAIVLG